MALIKEEEAFDAETDASPANSRALTDRFPALADGPKRLG
jgi:hypothetical protein